MTALDPDAIIAELLHLDGAVRLERYYGERSLFYNPGGRAPLGVIFASVKEHDGPHDAASRLSRPDVYRLAFQLPRTEYSSRFGQPPPRPPKGGVVELDVDHAALRQLMPHPVYAWMRWVHILAPTRADFTAILPLVEESLALAVAKWKRRAP